MGHDGALRDLVGELGLGVADSLDGGGEGEQSRVLSSSIELPEAEEDVSKGKREERERGEGEREEGERGGGDILPDFLVSVVREHDEADRLARLSILEVHEEVSTGLVFGSPESIS